MAVHKAAMSVDGNALTCMVAQTQDRLQGSADVDVEDEVGKYKADAIERGLARSAPDQGARAPSGPADRRAKMPLSTD
jgi:hypothetical protein